MLSACLCLPMQPAKGRLFCKSNIGEVLCLSLFMGGTLRLFMMPLQTVTAATAAAQAAAALGQLAAALAGQAPMEPTAIVAVPVTGVPLALNAALHCKYSTDLAPAPEAPLLARTKYSSSSKQHVCVHAFSTMRVVALQPPLSLWLMCPTWSCQAILLAMCSLG